MHAHFIHKFKAEKYIFDPLSLTVQTISPLISYFGWPSVARIYIGVADTNRWLEVQYIIYSVPYCSSISVIIHLSLYLPLLMWHSRHCCWYCCCGGPCSPDATGSCCWGHYWSGIEEKGTEMEGKATTETEGIPRWKLDH